MADRSRWGFTLVELLAVVVIIAMLVGLLLPAVIGARSRARRTQCSNNQHEIALAVQQYENAKKLYPGYINNFGASPNTRNLSWVVVIFPYLNQQQLWRQWRDTGTTTAQKYANYIVRVPQLICPADKPTEPGALSYVANCGIESGRQIEWPAGSGRFLREGPELGVFHNRTVSNPIIMTSERIHDGAQNTLLLSENIQATQWAPPLDASGQWTGINPGVRDWREAHVGMIWTLTPTACSPINACKENPIDPNDPEIKYARPSSRHPGGVVVTYCDGHQAFLDEQDADYPVYRRLMTPDGQRLGL